MEATKKLNIQRIEFANNQEWITIYGIVDDPNRNPSKSLSRLKIHQEELNRIINQLQANSEEEEVLSNLISEEISEDEMYYILNLQGTVFSTAWINLSEITDNYLLIRA